MSFFFLYLIMFVFEASLTIGPPTHNIVKERERERDLLSQNQLCHLETYLKSHHAQSVVLCNWSRPSRSKLSRDLN